ncbi:ATP-binding protein [Rheinheimera sp.]|uniref:ATP-binding protein n=1 Tax=Rheinheimera sp. TaxID=1869214 RepID=UPI00263800EB|nr:ATP-binding protein [Rheinheimera sp.]MCA1929799.1 response regulator [Rheinheimera sp.]
MFQNNSVRHSEPSFLRQLSYVSGLSLFGIVANLLALELPLSTPLLLGNLAFILVMQRLGIIWALLCAVVVLSPLNSPLYWICSLLQLLVFIPYANTARRRWVAVVLHFLATLVLFLWLPTEPQPFIWVLLNALIISSTLIVLKRCVRLFEIQAASLAQKRQQPFKSLLGSRIALMAAIPWALMISVLLHGTIVLNLSGHVSELTTQQQYIEGQLHQKLSSYQAELKLASDYARLVGDQESLQQLVKSQPEFISALRTDASGLVTAFFKEAAAQDILGHSVAYRDYFKQPKQSSQPYISDVFQGNKLGQDLLFALSRPLYQQEQFNGVLELSVALNRLTGALEVQHPDPRLQLLLTDGAQMKIWGLADSHASGQKVAFDNAALAESRAYLTHSPFYHQSHMHFNQTGDKIRLDSTIDHTNWQLFLYWDHGHLALYYQFLTLLALLTLLAGIELLSRSSQRFASGYTVALQQLITTIEGIELGSSTAPKQQLDNSALEFEQLLSSFTSLQRRLQAGHQALQSALEEKTNLSQQLEQRVAERTAELSIERDKAQQLALAKTRFLANMSHELRTPLTIILGFIQQALTRSHDAQLLNQLQTIDNQSKFLLQIVNDILDAAKMDEGKLPLELQHFELQPLLNELHQSLLPAAQEKGLHFSLQSRYPLPKTLYSDPLRLKQILMNLLGNALKFTQQGEVRLSAEIKQGQLSLSVTDTGPGISADMQQKLFSAFEQGDPGISRQFGGTGLGLYICKQLADLMGYQLELQSVPLQGSQFFLRIPLPVKAELLLKAPVQTSSKLQVQQQIPQLKGAVLIVDDVPDLRLLFSTLLSATGLEPQTARHGLDALHKVANQQFDLILMDMHMPVMDGLTASRELRRQGYQIPIIALTADVQAEQRQLCLEAGCQAVLTKPVQAQVLYDKIAEFLPTKSAVQAQSDVQQQLDQLTSMYKDSLPTVAQELEQLVQLEDKVATEALLHRIKGTSACFGFTRISALAAATERALKENHWPAKQLNELLQQIRQEQP